MFRICIVCTGNICRSPTAHGVLLAAVREAGLEGLVEVDSAGTHDYHAGEPPDLRAQEHAKRRGYDLSGLRARQISAGDFRERDLILAMDHGHLRLLQRQCPVEHRSKIRLFVEGRDVPDPYYGGPKQFEQVLDMIEAAVGGLVKELRTRYLRVSI